MNASWYEQEILQEFTKIINKLFPEVGKLLDQCYVKVIESYWGRDSVHFLPYMGIYCPSELLAAVEEHKDILKKVADHVGLVEVVCMNATRLVRDPRSRLKESHPRLWLELQWITAQEQQTV